MKGVVEALKMTALALLLLGVAIYALATNSGEDWYRFGLIIVAAVIFYSSKTYFDLKFAAISSQIEMLERRVDEIHNGPIGEAAIQASIDPQRFYTTRD